MIVILKAKTEEKEVERLTKELEKINVSVDIQLVLNVPKFKTIYSGWNSLTASNKNICPCPGTYNFSVKYDSAVIHGKYHVWFPGINLFKYIFLILESPTKTILL